MNKKNIFLALFLSISATVAFSMQQQINRILEDPNLDEQLKQAMVNSLLENPQQPQIQQQQDQILKRAKGLNKRINGNQPNRGKKFSGDTKTATPNSMTSFLQESAKKRKNQYGPDYWNNLGKK